MKALELSVILPVFNERGNLKPLLAEIHQALAIPFQNSFEVIAVDDGSTDGSREELLELCQEYPQLKVISFRKNTGQSAAFDVGFRSAEGKIVVTMDADLQNDPKDIPKLFEKLKNENSDFVSGWRKNRKDPFILRRLPSLISNFLIRKVTGTRVHDLGCSLKVFRAEILSELRLYGEMHRFICPLLENLGAKAGEMEVEHRVRKNGKSKYGLNRSFKVVLDLLHVWFLQNYYTKPLYVFGGLGFLMSTTGALLGAYSLFERFEYGIRVHRNPFFAIAVMLIIIGVQMVGTGLIAEFLIRTYFESRGKTPYLIRDKTGFKSLNPEIVSFQQHPKDKTPSSLIQAEGSVLRHR